MLSDIAAGRVEQAVFALPSGTAWPLPLYETRADDCGAGRIERCAYTLQLVTAEEAPLGIFGRKASDAVALLLEERGIECLTSTVPVAFEKGVLSVAPSGPVAADRVVAMPKLQGRSPAGLAHDADGFLPTDEHGRVRGCEDVYAAGDVTTFPVKQGGIATQQADAAARSISAQAGSPVQTEPFRPILRGLLLTGTARGSCARRSQGARRRSDVSTAYCGGRRRRSPASTSRGICPAASSRSSRRAPFPQTQYRSTST